jgi:hypothetical protein
MERGKAFLPAGHHADCPAVPQRGEHERDYRSRRTARLGPNLPDEGTGAMPVYNLDILVCPFVSLAR